MCLVPARHSAIAQLCRGLFPWLCHLDKICVPNKERALHGRSKVNVESTLWRKVRAMLWHIFTSSVGAPEPPDSNNLPHLPPLVTIFPYFLLITKWTKKL